MLMKWDKESRFFQNNIEEINIFVINDFINYFISSLTNICFTSQNMQWSGSTKGENTERNRKMRHTILIKNETPDRRTTTGGPGGPNPCPFFKSIKVPTFLEKSRTIYCISAE